MGVKRIQTRGSFQTVEGLLPGFGEGLLETKKRRKQIRVHRGRVVVKEGTKVLQSLQRRRSPDRIRQTFGVGTRLIRWKRSPQCEACQRGNTCTGLCSDT